MAILENSAASRTEARRHLVEVAADLRSWAAGQHLLGGAGSSVGGTEAFSLGAAARGFSGDAIEALHKAKLTGFSVNAATKTIYMLGNARPTKAIRAALPQALQDGTKVEYMQARPITVGETPDEATFGVQGAFQIKGKYACGASISPGNVRMAGTLGCLVKINGEIHGLSNNHVSGGCSQLPTGMPILAPGVMDVIAGGVPPFTLGFHADALAMIAGDPSIVDISQNSDAAVLKIDEPKSVTSFQRDKFDTPAVVIEPDDGMIVEKIGRTTGYTKGRVHSFRTGSTPVNYRMSVWTSPEDGVPVNMVVHFPEVWQVKGDGRTAFGAPGDSGSLVVGIDAKGHRRAVGLLFAGNADFTYILELGPILKRLNATLVSGHNTL